MVFDPFISELIRAFFLIIFAFTVFHKASDFGRFRQILGDYGVVPRSLLGPVSLCVVMWELATVAALIFVPQLGILFAACILAAYAILISFNILRGRTEIDCGCSWGAKSLTDVPRLRWQSVFRNLALVAIGVFGLIPVSGRVLGGVDYLNLAAVCTVAFIAYQASSTLMQNYNRMKDYGHV